MALYAKPEADVHLQHEALDSSLCEGLGHAVQQAAHVMLAVFKDKEDAAPAPSVSFT